MATWYTVGLITQYSATVTWTRTSATPSSGSVQNNTFLSEWGGYGGSGNIPTTVTVANTQDGGDITAPSRTGYSFAGWFTFAGTSASAVSLDDATVLVATTRKITYPELFAAAGRWTSQGADYYMIYAKWSPRELVVTLNTNGGVLPSGTNYFVRVYYDSTYGSLPTPTREGYTFAGWYTAASGGTRVRASTTVTQTSNHTIYAHWTANPVVSTLYFDAAGGTVSETSRQVTSGTPYGTLPTPAMRTGYVFDGWYTRATGGDLVTAATVAGSEDTTIYAHWSGVMLTITFDANGGIVSETTRTVETGNQYGTLPVPTRTDYVFDGWYTEQTGGRRVTAADYPITSHTLWAHWTAAAPIGWWVVETW